MGAALVAGGSYDDDSCVGRAAQWNVNDVRAAIQRWEAVTGQSRSRAASTTTSRRGSKVAAEEVAGVLSDLAGGAPAAESSERRDVRDLREIDGGRSSRNIKEAGRDVVDGSRSESTPNPGKPSGSAMDATAAKSAAASVALAALGASSTDTESDSDGSRQQDTQAGSFLRADARAASRDTKISTSDPESRLPRGTAVGSHTVTVAVVPSAAGTVSVTAPVRTPAAATVLIDPSQVARTDEKGYDRSGRQRKPVRRRRKPNLSVQVVSAVNGASHTSDARSPVAAASSLESAALRGSGKLTARRSSLTRRRLSAASSGGAGLTPAPLPSTTRRRARKVLLDDDDADKEGGNDPRTLQRKLALEQEASADGAIERVAASLVTRNEFFVIFTPNTTAESGAPTMLDFFNDFSSEDAARRPPQLPSAARTRRSSRESAPARDSAAHSQAAASGFTPVSRFKPRGRQLKLHESPGGSLTATVRSGSNTMVVSAGAAEAAAMLPDVQYANARVMMCLLLMLCSGTVSERSSLLFAIFGGYLNDSKTLGMGVFIRMVRTLVQAAVCAKLVQRAPPANKVDELATEAFFTADSNVGNSLDEHELLAWVSTQVKTRHLLRKLGALDDTSHIDEASEAEKALVTKRRWGASLKAVTASVRMTRMAGTQVAGQSGNASKITGVLAAATGADAAQSGASPRQAAATELSSEDDGLWGNGESATGWVDGKLSLLMRHSKNHILATLTRGALVQHLVQNTRFSRTEVVWLAHIFAAADGRVATGHINQGALSSILLRFLPGLETVMGKVFRALDTDQNGMVSFREFVEGFSMMLRGDVTEKLSVLYSLADKTEEGEIEVSELIRLVSPDSAALQDILEFSDTLVAEMDADNDGECSPAEFLAVLVKNPALRDTFTNSTEITVDMTRALRRMLRVVPGFNLETLSSIPRRYSKRRTTLTRPIDRDAFFEFIATEFGADISDAGLSNALDYIFGQYDHALTGRVVLRDVLMLFSQFLAPTSDAQVNMLFALSDLDNSGSLDPNEVLLALLSTKQATNREVANVMVMLTLLDEDGGGTVSRRELLTRGPRVQVVMEALSRLFFRARELTAPETKEAVRRKAARRRRARGKLKAAFRATAMSVRAKARALQLQGPKLQELGEHPADSLWMARPDTGMIHQLKLQAHAERAINVFDRLGDDDDDYGGDTDEPLPLMTYNGKGKPTSGTDSSSISARLRVRGALFNSGNDAGGLLSTVDATSTTSTESDDSAYAPKLTGLRVAADKVPALLPSVSQESSAAIPSKLEIGRQAVAGTASVLDARRRASSTAEDEGQAVRSVDRPGKVDAARAVSPITSSDGRLRTNASASWSGPPPVGLVQPFPPSVPRLPLGVLADKSAARRRLRDTQSFSHSSRPAISRVEALSFHGAVPTPRGATARIGFSKIDADGHSGARRPLAFAAAEESAPEWARVSHVRRGTHWNAKKGVFELNPSVAAKEHAARVVEAHKRRVIEVELDSPKRGVRVREGPAGPRRMISPRVVAPYSGRNGRFVLMNTPRGAKRLVDDVKASPL